MTEGQDLLRAYLRAYYRVRDWHATHFGQWSPDASDLRPVGDDAWEELRRLREDEAKAYEAVNNERMERYRRM